ncbi:M23 family metallopeptidase [Kibdelosporangium philippinense]|uniref:M23 family metallopeptidase n=1 Tax=Kibdelosporangium philippinense TaxID=211113 RepID=A0ABS8ZDQ0_9PSEU|nr:M23 family metallopeptidase [Kibdelosporangium philippinense]MCE7005976.1 M23 family metallopeptidase [Kibdelosporangium philippinense]
MVEALERPSADDRVERGAHRLPAPPSALRGRVVVAAVALGAFAAAAAGQTLKGGAATTDGDVTPLANAQDASAALGVGGDSRGATIAPEILTVAQVSDAGEEARKLTQSAQLIANRTAKIQKEAAEAAEKARVKYVRPAEGAFTSGFGARWGTTHFGIDIANRIGTPIRAVTDGVVIEAGPASGFGLWVRIQHADGTISVYGHMDTIGVREGAKVKAGDQIARMGNRGQSTGPHLHFEIWDANGRKMNPASWCAQKGIRL